MDGSSSSNPSPNRPLSRGSRAAHIQNGCNPLPVAHPCTRDDKLTGRAQQSRRYPQAQSRLASSVQKKIVAEAAANLPTSLLPWWTWLRRVRLRRGCRACSCSHRRRRGASAFPAQRPQQTPNTTLVCLRQPATPPPHHPCRPPAAVCTSLKSLDDNCTRVALVQCDCHRHPVISGRRTRTPAASNQNSSLDNNNTVDCDESRRPLDVS